MEKISFCKMSGAGNDFIVFDIVNNPQFCLSPEVISGICNRRNGIGADGVITVKALPDFSFDMVYYNADGSTGTLCGNGARCAIKFAYEKGFIANSASFSSGGNIYSGEVIDESLIRFNLNNPYDIKTGFNIDFESSSLTVHFANTGSPHLIVFNKDFDKFLSYYSGGVSLKNLNVATAGKILRYHPFFGNAGTNVNFVEVQNKQINIRTFERGVEDETLACGTGSVAAAVICRLLNLVETPVKLNTAGGESLIVDFNLIDNIVTAVSLTGPAKIVFAGTIEL